MLSAIPTSSAPSSATTIATTPAAIADAATAARGAFEIDGYFAGYEQGQMNVAQVDFRALSRLMVARVVPRADGSLETSFDTADARTGVEFADSAARAAHQAGRKAILMVGGEGAHAGFVAATRDLAKRANLVRELTRFASMHRFDGLDLDWEPIESEDHPSLLALVDALHAAAPALELSVPVGWDAKTDAFYGELAKRVSRINIMSYAMAGAWPQWSSWHTSALRGDTPQTPSSVARAVKTYLDSGVPRDKLGIGAGFFGMCWQKVSGPGQLLGQAGNAGRVVAGDGTLPFSEISRTYKPLAEKAGEALFDEVARAPHLHFKTPAGPKACTWISYEDERSLREKARFIKAERLAGIILWTLPQGLLRERGEQPLLRALAEER